MSTNGLLLTEEPARRGFLRSLVMAPFAALATHKLILPGQDSPEDRARRAWAEFSAAMREITAGEHGWLIVGAGERKPFRHTQGGAFLNLRAIRYEVGSEPHIPAMIVEHHRELIL